MADKLRCAVIGAGGFGFDHLHSLTNCHRAAVVAVAETNPQRAREACARYHVPRGYADYRELLEQPDIDAVTIALPNHLHAPVAIEALKARKHVLVEKPIALNAKEAAKVIDVAKNMKRVLMVGQNYRFNRHTHSARVLIDRGDLGEIYHARGFWLRRHGIPRIGSWFTQKNFSGGGCLIDLGVHLLDTCFYLFKEFDVVSVTAQTYAKFGPRGLGEMDWGKSDIDPKKPFDVEDYCVALVRLKSGRSLVLETGWASFHTDEQREFGLDLLGTNAGLSLWPARLFRHTIEGDDVLHVTPMKTALSEDRIHHFIGCVLDGKRPLVTLEESLKLQQVLDALYLSAKSGKEVRLT